jgi:putative MATE family efflux protein
MMRNNRQNMLATEGVGKLLWKLSLPAAVGGVVMTLYNVVDTIFIGQVVGPLGIAGLTIVFPVQMIGMGMGMMIGIGGASLASRALGADDVDKAERTLGNVLFFTVTLGLLLTIIGLANSTFWLRLVGASETILPHAKEYMDVILIGMAFRMFGMGMSHLIRAEGNARAAMMCMVIGFLLNIALDAVFVMALRMGIKGAAIATVISELLTCLYVSHYYLFRNSTLKIHLKNIIPERRVTRDIMTIGFGSLVRTAGASFVSIIVNRTLVAYGGDLAVASYGMVNRTMMFIFLPVMSVGQGLQPILGFSYGAKRIDRALRVIKLATIFATLSSVVVFAVLFFFPNFVVRIFTTDSSLISAGAYATQRVFFVAYLMGFQMVGSVVFQALGKAVPTFLTATSRHILFLLPLVFILPRFMQLDGIWLSFPIADVLSFILTLALFIPQIRALKRLEVPAAEISRSTVTT